MLGDGSAEHALYHVCHQRFSGDKTENVRRWLGRLEVCGRKEAWTNQRLMFIAKRALRETAALVARCEEFGCYEELKKILIDEFGSDVRDNGFCESERCGFYDDEDDSEYDEDDESVYGEDDESMCSKYGEDVDVGGCLREVPRECVNKEQELDVKLSEEPEECMILEPEKRVEYQNMQRNHNHSDYVVMTSDVPLLSSDVDSDDGKNMKNNDGKVWTMDTHSRSFESLKDDKTSNPIESKNIDDIRYVLENIEDPENYNWDLRNRITHYDVGKRTLIRGKLKTRRFLIGRWQGVKFKMKKNLVVQRVVLKDFKKRKKF